MAIPNTVDQPAGCVASLMSQSVSKPILGEEKSDMGKGTASLGTAADAL